MSRPNDQFRLPNHLRYESNDFPNFDEGTRSVARHSRNEKNRQSPIKQKKYSAICAMPVVGQMPALLINAIVQKMLTILDGALTQNWF
jgi:hypothetical protein